LTHDIEARQYTLESMSRQKTGSLVQLPESMEQQVKELQLEFQLLKDGADGRRRYLAQVVADQEALHETLTKVMAWVEEKEKLFDGSQSLPLGSADVKKKLDDSKVSFY
jgi:hypothetical protein